MAIGSKEIWYSSTLDVEFAPCYDNAEIWSASLDRTDPNRKANTQMCASEMEESIVSDSTLTCDTYSHWVDGMGCWESLKDPAVSLSL